MLIDRPTHEDLSMLNLLISKLEDSLDKFGIQYFEYERSEMDIERIFREHSGLNDDYYDYQDNEKPLFKPRPVKRVELHFNSKRYFTNYWDMNEEEIDDNGEYVASFLKIEWDHITNIFTVCLGTIDFEKDSNNSKYLRRTNTSESKMVIDFSSEYRREIISIKKRLGKLYSKLIRDKKVERERRTRKNFTDSATKAFPDLLDPLILGGFFNEKRDS